MSKVVLLVPVQFTLWLSGRDLRHIHEIMPKHKYTKTRVTLIWAFFVFICCPVVRYSHSAHVIGDILLVVGGVWLHSDAVPDVAVVNLITRSCLEFRLDRVIQSSQAVPRQAAKKGPSTHLCSGLCRTPFPGRWCCTRSALRWQTQKNQSCSCSVVEGTVSLSGPTLTASPWLWTWQQRCKVNWGTLKAKLSKHLSCAINPLLFI